MLWPTLLILTAHQSPAPVLRCNYNHYQLGKAGFGNILVSKMEISRKYYAMCVAHRWPKKS